MGMLRSPIPRSPDVGAVNAVRISALYGCSIRPLAVTSGNSRTNTPLRIPYGNKELAQKLASFASLYLESDNPPFREPP
jgi:hypothetical protein